MRNNLLSPNILNYLCGNRCCEEGKILNVNLYSFLIVTFFLFRQKYSSNKNQIIQEISSKKPKIWPTLYTKQGLYILRLLQLKTYLRTHRTYEECTRTEAVFAEAFQDDFRLLAIEALVRLGVDRVCGRGGSG